MSEILFAECDANDKSDQWLEKGSREGNHRISLKQTAFSWIQFARWKGQAKYSTFN